VIQILGLRDFENKHGKRQKKEVFFGNGWRAQSVKELFANLDEHLAPIPNMEKQNLYYTAADCL